MELKAATHQPLVMTLSSFCSTTTLAPLWAAAMAEVVPAEPRPTMQISVSMVSTISSSAMGSGLVSQLQRVPGAAAPSPVSLSFCCGVLGAQPAMPAAAAPPKATAAPVRKLRREMLLFMMASFLGCRARPELAASALPLRANRVPLALFPQGFSVRQRLRTLPSRLRRVILFPGQRGGRFSRPSTPFAKKRGDIVSDGFFGSLSRL